MLHVSIGFVNWLQILTENIKAFDNFVFGNSAKFQIELEEGSLNNLDKNLQRASTGFLCEMSVDRMSLDIIYKENHVSVADKRTSWNENVWNIYLEHGCSKWVAESVASGIWSNRRLCCYCAISGRKIALELSVQFFQATRDWTFKYIYMNYPLLITPNIQFANIVFYLLLRETSLEYI